MEEARVILEILGRNIVKKREQKARKYDYSYEVWYQDWKVFEISLFGSAKERLTYSKQVNFFKKLTLSPKNSKQDELCLLGLMTKEINGEEFFDYLRARGNKTQNSDVTPELIEKIKRKKDRDANIIKNITIIDQNGITIDKYAVIKNQNKAGVGYELSLSALMNLGNFKIFDLLNMKDGDEGSQNFFEFRWKVGNRIGIYWPRYSRAPYSTNDLMQEEQEVVF
ncbi:MAG: hypothetical protein KJ771_00635 [Nanoarchaeota archaeon]|nr:hypothetical protein [Nanoarchaeota archaeon]